ncbi:MAG: fused uroporphyrinogen-III synthase HemD/membrane protein HemX [Burkholderiales bacterium]|nr:fused uroporphyrinogen-III synthase HemD/membrane protein HemX [Burkholderiales bacterium]MDE2502096.1 fused uroporphyrinogen-III synthase HemD/membrane protein HemX [Burkholderiales bacterium]
MVVIVTRPRDQAAAWLEGLQAQGWPARSLPLIEIGPPPDTEPLRQAWARLGGYALVMFVSANAVHGFFAAADEAPIWPPALRAASTGPGTTAALRAAGLADAALVEPAADAASFDSEALWRRLEGEEWTGRRVLVVRGDGGRDWLADRLRERGATVDFVAAYRRLAPRPDAAGQALLAQALARPREAVWLLSSSEALGHLRNLAPQADWSAARAIATHARIAEAAREFGYGAVELAAPTPGAVAAALARMAADTIGAPVNPTPLTPQTPAAATAEARPVPVVVAATTPSRWTFALALVYTLLLAAAWMLAWNTQQRVKTLEAELVKRQQDSGVQATEARTLAQQAETASRESAAKMALLEARVDETSIQRSQLEDLIQSLSRSRDENVLADIDTSVRVAMRQAAITGSAEPLLATLKQADDRLSRYNQPRLERVRRAVMQDMDRVRGAGVTDINGLTIRLDDVIRQVDELPLLSGPEHRAHRAPAPAAAAAKAPSAAASAAGWREWVHRDWRALADRVWQEVRGLVRVTRIEAPEAMLIAPDQAFFLRENLKLRLLNARLALLSRQFDTAQSDLRDAQAALERYFDRGSRRVTVAIEQLRQVRAQARQINVPEPDATLAALAAASAGR